MARGLEEEIADLEVAKRSVEEDLEEDHDITVVNEQTLQILDRPFVDEGLRALLESWELLDNQLRAKRDQLNELESSTVTVVPPIFEIELGISWSQYQNGAWSAKTIGTRKLIYEASTPSSKHCLIGWVSSTNQLRIAVTTVSGERTEEGATQTCIGHFYLDESHGGLVATPAAVAFPQGEVYVSGAYQRFQAWDSFISETLTLEVGDDGDAPRALLGTVPIGSVDIHFGHQYGLGGGETSPFFYTDDTRTYVVEPLPDARIGSEFAAGSVLTTGRSARARARVAPRAARTALTSTTHYQDVSTDAIIDRVTQDTLPGVIANQAGWAGSVLVEEKAPDILMGGVAVTGFRYRFTRFYHPYTSLCLRQLSRQGVDGLLKPDPDWDEDSSNLYRQLTPNPAFDFVSTYAPDSSWVYQNYTTEQIEETFDFDHDSPYGVYNWELFFHIPLLIASRLMQNQRFDEARQWFHYVFDATNADGDDTSRFWKIKPFYEAQLAGPGETLQELIDLLEAGSASLEQQVLAWQREPFNPHAIARLRITAYMQATVRKYLDCLIQHGDMLFGRDTREYVREAALLYLLAAEILGERPTLLPPHDINPSTPNLLLERYQIILGPGVLDDILDRLTSLMSSTFSGIGSARSTMRATTGGGLLNPTIDRPVNVAVGTTTIATTTTAQGGTDSFNTLTLFEIPRNDLLDSYWATVSDRLFKIRHCMNISGQVRQLALYSPPIDPMLLVRAAAAGLSIDSIVGGALTALPPYRFAVLLPKAMELCGEVRSLGSALLAALERKDGEALAVLRSTHEVSLLKSIRALKSQSVDEAESQLASLTRSKESAEFRVTYYASQERVSVDEQKSLNKQEDSRHRQRDAEFAETIAAVLHIIPSFPGFTFGGPNLGSAGQAVAAGFRGRSAFFAFEASKIGTMAGYDRRLQDWTFQKDLAAKEIEQLDQQILAAEIRKAIATNDLDNHDQQIAQSIEVEDFLKFKFTDGELHDWMISKLSSVYFQAYQLAYQMAKQAERAFQHELGPDEATLSFFDVPYWDSLRKGLTAGEQLALDLRRLEQAHLDANRRELEITKPVSIFQLDPAALLTLRQTGACDIHIPEVLFDLDFAGHLFRRIKAVRLTIPGVTGPYTNVSATLTLKQSWTRREIPLDMTAPPEVDTTVLPQTAIATCTGVSDSGMFDFGFNDPRYLPFEGAGAISTWRLELPSALRQFDYNTIADVVMHLSYTARDAADGGAFSEMVNSNLVTALNDWKKLVSNDDAITPARLFSLRHDFPTEWNRLTFQADEQTQQSVTLSLGKQHFPRHLDFFWSRNGNGLEAQPISLGLSAGPSVIILSPAGAPPPESDVPTVALSGLSEISNDAGANVVITVEDGVLDPAQWRDLYLLLSYEIVA